MQNITRSLSEQEINNLTQEFLNKYTVVIKAAAGNAQLDSYYYDDLVSLMAVKYSSGQLVFDPARNTKDTTYIYRIARNAAIDIIRKNNPWANVSTIDENDPDSPGSKIPDYGSLPDHEVEDTMKILCQTFDCLENQYHFSKKNLKLFLEWNLTQVSARELAEKYGLNKDYLSNQFSKIKKAYCSVYKELRKKEDDGTLKLSVNLADYDWVVEAVA